MLTSDARRRSALRLRAIALLDGLTLDEVDLVHDLVDVLAARRKDLELAAYAAATDAARRHERRRGLPPP